MSRELMPKSGIMMPHVVVNRDAAVVGVSTVDGVAGAVDLTGKYLQKTDAAATYQTKTEGASKTYVLDSIQPIMEGALFKADPFVDNNIPFRSAGANGVESVDMIKVTPENSIKLGSYESSVQGVEIHSAGRVVVVDKNDSGVETKYPVYSKRFRPEVEDLPFAAIGSYVKDSKGRTIGVTRTGINSDIKQLTQKVTFTQPVTIPDAVGDYDAVTLRQLGDFKAELLSGTSGLVDSKAINVTPQGTLAEMHYYVTPDQFASLVPGGEYVDEDTDFTLAVQGAINYAAAHPGIVVRGTDKVYGTGRIGITVGAKCIDSLKIKCVVAGTDTLLYSFVDAGHTDLVIRNCDLNGNGNTSKGIIVSGAIRSTIEKNRVYGLDGTKEAYGIRIGTTSVTSMNINNKISDNIIEMPTDPWGGRGNYAICGIGMIGQVASLYGGLDTNDGVAAFPSTITLRDTIISGNFISGGTHGVQGLGLFRALITENHITTNTHRNINLSPNCQRVDIASNVLIEGGSSGVNVAWGCRWINITGNYIQTSTASVSPSDDAAIQLYKSVDQATVGGNTILGDWKYSVYMGAAVTNVTVQGNGLFAGSLASIAIESDWVLPATYPLAIYSTSRDPSTTPVTTDTGNINIGGNAYGAGACAIYMTATNSRALYNVNIHDEVINSVTSRPHVVYAYDAGTLMTDGVLSNISARGATSDKYYLSRGRRAFSVIKDVTALDDPTAEVTVTGSTPSAVFGPNLYIASGTITDFTGSRAGDIINVRMADGVILTHNDSVMRLKGGVNATASGGLAIVVLQRRANVWFELSRNF